MKVGEACTRPAVVIGEKESALEAARLMRRFHVGDLVIVREGATDRVPVGMVTDRDLALEILAQDVDPDAVEVADLAVERRLVTASEDEDLEEALERMRTNGVRRLPVVDGEGHVVGVLSADDALELLTEGLSDLVHLVGRQRRLETRIR